MLMLIGWLWSISCSSVSVSREYSLITIIVLAAGLLLMECSMAGRVQSLAVTVVIVIMSVPAIFKSRHCTYSCTQFTTIHNIHHARTQTHTVLTTLNKCTMSNRGRGLYQWAATVGHREISCSYRGDTTVFKWPRCVCECPCSPASLAHFLSLYVLLLSVLCFCHISFLGYQGFQSSSSGDI